MYSTDEEVERVIILMKDGDALRHFLACVHKENKRYNIWKSET